MMPNPAAASAHRLPSVQLHPRVREMVDTGSRSVDRLEPAVRPYLDRYLRGTGGRAVGSECLADYDVAGWG